jgi:glycosyltransferase involved in cell wall biosynthesis
MINKKKIHLFFRKPSHGLHFSIENWYFGLIKSFNNEYLEFKIKICPLESKGVFNRIFITIWAFFNQGDINHVTGDINFISLFLSKKKTINTILDYYSLTRLKGIKKKIYYLFWVKIPAIKSSHLISISNKTKKEIIKYTNFNKKKITVSDVCIQDIYKKNKKKFNKKKPKILIIGTNKNKNIKNILMSLININCELLIIGELIKEHLDLLKKYKLSYKNYIALNSNGVFKKYTESDILLFASISEGFGMPILESQTVGRPVITSNLEPMTHVGGNAAFYVNPRSIKSIRNGVVKILSSKVLRDKLTINGFKNIKRFNKTKILQKHLSCYYNILNNNF